MFRNYKNRNRSTPKDENLGNVTFGKQEPEEDCNESTGYEAFGGNYEQIFADETGSGYEETTIEKERKAATIQEIEQTSFIEVSQPEGITRPIKDWIKRERKGPGKAEEKYLVSESGLMKDTTDEDEVFDDGGKRFEEFKIRRPNKESRERRRRRELHPHRNRGCKLTLQNDTEEELTLDGENSANSIFCTPKEYPLCNNEEHPLVTQRILKIILVYL